MTEITLSTIRGLLNSGQSLEQICKLHSITVSVRFMRQYLIEDGYIFSADRKRAAKVPVKIKKDILRLHSEKKSLTGICRIYPVYSTQIIKSVLICEGIRHFDTGWKLDRAESTSRLSQNAKDAIFKREQSNKSEVDQESVDVVMDAIFKKISLSGYANTAALSFTCRHRQIFLPLTEAEIRILHAYLTEIKMSEVAANIGRIDSNGRRVLLSPITGTVPR